LKKGIYKIDGTLKINKALTIRAEDGCPHEVSKHTASELMLGRVLLMTFFIQDVVISGTAPVDKKGVLMEITGKVTNCLSVRASSMLQYEDVQDGGS
jgi:hypothetical protein